MMPAVSSNMYIHHDYMETVLESLNWNCILDSVAFCPYSRPSEQTIRAVSGAVAAALCVAGLSR